jgi:hypothetical protein
VDNTMPSINATTIPNLVRTGDVVTITATADSDTAALTAKILGIIYDMVKGADGTWILQYTVPQVSDGFKNILLTATDHLGNQGTASTGFTVDNTPPTMHAVVNPDLTKSGNVITLKVTADLDTQNMTASIRGVNYNLVKGSDGKWALQYAVPMVSDGSYGILLTATDMVGNKGTCTVNFVVDNTPPTIHASVTPGVTRSGGTITLKVTADSDTKSLTARIRGKSYNLVKGADGVWILRYTVPDVSSGDYDIYLTATDQLGNQGNATVSFTVDNTPPASSTSSNNNCGAVALANLLGSLGIGADAGTIASLAGTDESGTSFYGLVQAAKQFGVDLTGLKVDSDQLQAGDIVLLNMGGANHYGIILGKIGDYVILQDPFLGTVVLSLDEFNKYYTGYALTISPDGRGVPLSVDEMMSLIGGGLPVNIPISSGLEELFASWVATEEASAEIPGPGWIIAILLAVGGAVFFGGNALLDRYAPDLIPHKGTGWKGLGIDLFNTLSPFIQLDQDGLPKSRYDLTQGYIDFSIVDGNVKKYLMGLGGGGDDDGDIIGKLIEGAKNAPWYVKIPAYVAAGSLAVPYFAPIVYPFIDPAISAAKSAINSAVKSAKSVYNNAVKPILNKVNKEIKEFQQKDL